MRTPKFKPGIKERMQFLLAKAKKASEVKRIQCVLFGTLGASSVNIGPMVGFHPQYVRVVWLRYREEGETFLLEEKRGRSRARAHLTLEEEASFLKPFLRAADKGGLLTVSEVHRAYEKEIGKTAQPSVVYRLLARHGWRKIAPRPSHPKSDKEATEKFRGLFPLQRPPRKSDRLPEIPSSQGHVSG